MTQENTLQTWWAEVTFPTKEQYQLSETGDLVLNPIEGNKERTIITLELNNADAQLKSLLEKFPEVEAKVKELQDEWDVEQEDKLKLAGKVERTKDYLQHAVAVGDYTPLFQNIAVLEKEIAAKTEENFAAKEGIVKEAEAVVESEDWKETTQKFKDLIEQWKATGYIDKKRNDELWERLEAARTKFFERKRAHTEDIEKELLQNLDLKLELVEKAEKLAASDDWKRTTEAFKQLMEEWKAVGRTMHDKNEQLWNRYITAKNAFFDKKKAHYNTIKAEQEKNYTVKLALVEKAEELKDSQEWNKTSDAYTKIMEEWKATGRVPREHSDELWARLNAAKDTFYQAKREHFQAFKVSLQDNYARKQALLKRAEQLKNSTRWREATAEINELMTEWKSIGPVPREHSDTIWEQFVAARKHFYNRKDADREQRKEHAEKRIYTRHDQTKKFVATLEEELQEEKDKLVDFKEGLANIDPELKKADELKEHLTKLIAQTEKNLVHKQEKLEEVQAQLKDIGAQIAEKEKQQTEEPKEKTSKKEEASKDAVATTTDEANNDTEENKEA
ncbi:MAG: DUF349 domain-containing protein [Flavipsychrobacter sp.]